MPATARLQHLAGVLTAPGSPKIPVAPSPTVTSFPSGLVNSALLPGFVTVDSPVTPPALLELTHIGRQHLHRPACSLSQACL